MAKIIMCSDMDAFFASVEQKTNPLLRNKPIAVIGSGARTVITTASYEARMFGVTTGMTVYEAKKLCPHLIFVVGNNEKYTSTSKELERIYTQFTPDVEIYSIDEAFLDITATHHMFGGVDNVARGIKKAIREHFGITCTIGIGPTILIAKLASDLAKPDGLRWIKEEEVPSLLEHLPVKKLWGIGARTAYALASMGIETCGDLGRAPVSILRRRFGIMGEVLKGMGMGIWARPIMIHEQEPRSIGHSTTLPFDIWTREEIGAYMLQLSEMVGRRARRFGYRGRRVSLTIRYTDFETFTKQMTFPAYTNDTHTICRYAFSILDTIRLRKRIRLMGIRLSLLIRETCQMELFGEFGKRHALVHAMDTVNDRYGEHTLAWASYVHRRELPRVISPAWRPTGIRSVHIK